MEEALIALLIGNAGVQSKVGSRMWPGMAPQKTGRPFGVLQVISSVPDYAMAGASGYVPSRVQIDLYAETYSAAKAAARAVKAVLSGYSGGGFQGIFVDSERDLPDDNTGAVQVERLHRVSLDFSIHHSQE